MPLPMLERLGGRGLLSGGGVLSGAGARRLSRSALVLLLLTSQASRTVNDPNRLLLAVGATGLIGLVWCAQLLRPSVLGIWLLGLAGVALVLLVPGAAPSLPSSRR